MYFTRPTLVSLLFGVTAFLATIPAVNAQTNESAEVVSITPPALAFARYIAFLDRRDVFTESGPVVVDIRASLPKQSTEAHLKAIRDSGPCERSEYNVLQLEGDPTQAQVIIGRYVSAQAQIEKLPLSSILITPANYRFRYVGSIYRSGATIYVFQITPKERRLGLIQGQLWIDDVTGVPVHETGRLVKPPSGSFGRIRITSDVNLRGGIPYQRITHAVIDAPGPIGRADLVVTESPLKSEEEQRSTQLAEEEK